MGQSCTRVEYVEDYFVVDEVGVTLPARSYTKFGWKKDTPDFRDRVLALPESQVTGLPPKVDLRPKENLQIYDQGNLGSCTANALAAAFHFSQVRQGLKSFPPARLFIYYNERSMEGNPDVDCGAYMRDGVKSLHRIGVCSEEAWAYDINKFTDKPSPDCYSAATKNQCLEYARVPQTLDDLKAALNEGLPICFGFVVCRSFMNREVASTGSMCMPQANDRPLGGHAVMAVGYEDERKCFIVQNSWSSRWGDHGYFYMPYDYMTSDALAGDFWVIKVVKGQHFPCKKQ